MTTRHGIDELAEDLALQRLFFLERVPVYGALLDMLGETLGGTRAQRLSETWAGREFSSVYERPLLLLAALRFDALREGAAHPLYAAVASDAPALGAATRGALDAALDDTRTSFWDSLAQRFVQTNETSRAVAWLWPASLMQRAAGWEALTLIDLGTSAGLNLVADALPAPWTRSDAAPLVLEPRPRVAQRLGLDRAPLDASDALTADWLRACVWPGDVARLGRLELSLSALATLRAQGSAPELRAVDLGDALGTLRAVPDSRPALAVQTIVRDYLPEALRARHREQMLTWLGERAPGRALWVELELAAGNNTPTNTGCAITVHVRARDGALAHLDLARCHPHPSVLHVDDAAVRALLDAAGP